MTIFFPSSTTPCYPSSSPKEEFSREYPLSSGSTFKIVFDSIRGASGILLENGKEIKVSFEDFTGIPRDVRFNSEKLAKFLEDTYIKLNRSEDKHITVIINQRVKGGGNSHSSSYSESCHYTSPPPTIYTSVSYSAGFPIRSLEKVEHIAGSYTNEIGGLDQTNFSVTFATQSAGVHPNVTIKVWKSDYYAAQILQLQSLKAIQLQAKTNQLAKKQSLENTKSNITKMLQSLQNHQAAQKSNLLAKQQVYTEISLVDEEIKKLNTSLTELSKQISEEGPNIRSLIDLLAMINRLGIHIVQPAHLPIHQFTARDFSKDTLIGSTANPNGLLGITVVKLNAVLSESQKANGKDIVAFVGNTGTGKSTAVNHLLGIPMQFIDGVVKVANGEQEIAKIGHHAANSETLLTQIYEKANVPFILADCGGYFDTRGTSNDVAVVTSLKLSLESAQSVKLVLCFDANLLSTNRGTLFYESLKLTLETLLKNYKEHGNSVVMMLTKPSMSLDGVIFNSKVACQMITEIMNDLPEGSTQKELYQFLLRDNGKYICVCNPLSDSKNSDIYQILSEMSAIKNTKEAFQVACTPNSQLALLEEMTKTAIKANELFSTHKTITARIAEERLKSQALYSKLVPLEKEKQQIDEAIKQEESFLQNNNMANNNSQLAATEQQINAFQQQIDSYDSQISLKNNNQFVVYQKSNGGDWIITE